jgi:hypothetical protein
MQLYILPVSSFRSGHGPENRLQSIRRRASIISGLYVVKRVTMQDYLMLLYTTIFFGLAFSYVAVCRKLR